MLSGGIPEPVKGGGVRHSWGVEITRAVNRSRVVGAPGMLCNDSELGFGYTPIAQNKRTSRVIINDKSPFRIGTNSDGDYGIIDCYFMVGGVMMSISDAVFSGSGEQSASAVFAAQYAGKYAALVIHENDNASARIAAVPVDGDESSMSLAEMQRDLSLYVHPLYLFDDKGAVQVDFRSMPQIQKFEVFS